VLTGLLTGRSSPNRKSQFPTCEEGETGCSRLRALAHRPVSRGVSFGQTTARPMRSPAVRCELRRGWNSAILGEMVGLALARTVEPALFAVNVESSDVAFSPIAAWTSRGLGLPSGIRRSHSDSAVITASSSHSADDDPQRGGASGVILRESPTTADPSGPCRERRAPRWRSPALPVAWASLIGRCQQQHRGAIWPVGACRRLG
jgi:hypothetical protein